MAVTTVAATRTKRGGLFHYFARIEEANAGSGSDGWAITGLPSTGTITLRKVTPTFGTSVSIAPSVGRAQGFAVDTDDEIDTLSSSTIVNNAENVRYDGLDNNTMYGKTGWDDSTADNDAVIEITVVEGHLL